MATQPLHAMTVGPDGNLWFTDAYNGKVVRVTPQGVFTAFAVDARPSGDPVAGIAPGTDGNLWYIAAGKLGHTSPQGKTGAVALPAGVVATSLTAGPDGNLWLSESRATGSAVRKSADTIAKVTPSGQFTAYSLTSAGFVSAGGLTPGPDGNVWFVGITRSSSAIGRITPAGAVSVFPVDIPVQTTAPGYPACEPVDIGPCLAGSNIGGLVAGGDGNLWFIDGQGRIGRMTPSGATTFFQAYDLEGLNGPPAIGKGPDGNIWFAYGTPSQGTGVIKRMTADGAVKPFALPHGGGISNIIAGPDGSVRFLLTVGGGNEPLSTQRLVQVTP
jgi:virginiamycin B lyase